MAYRCVRNAGEECDGCGYCKPDEEPKKKCCGTCRWHEYDETEEAWVCVSENSENYSDFTAYNDSCDEYDEIS